MGWKKETKKMIQAEILKNKILKKVEKYYQAKWGDYHKIFIPNHCEVPYAGRIFDEQELLNLIKASLEFWLTEGQWTKKFEKELNNFIKVNYSLLTNSGSSANLLSFLSLTSHKLKDRRIKRGDEVITCASCFPTTITPILLYGAVPVFADCEYSTGNILPDQVEKLITKKTKAIIAAHTLGNPFDLKEIKNICKKHKLWLVEDCCDSLGAKWFDDHVGTIGDIGTLSFFPAHHLCGGEAGAVFTENKQLYDIMKSIRDWGRDCKCDIGEDNSCGKRFSHRYKNLPNGFDHKYVYEEIGLNLKATDLQAAILCAQIKKLPEFVRKRIVNYKYLYNNLIEFEEYFEFSKVHKLADPSWFAFPIYVKTDRFTKNELVKFLEEKKIQTRSLFAGNIVRHPMIDNLIEGKEYKVPMPLENCDKVLKNSFFIGCYPGLSREHLEYIVECFNEFLKRYKER